MSRQGSRRRGLWALSLAGIGIVAVLAGCQKNSAPNRQFQKSYQQTSRLDTGIIGGTDAKGTESFASSVVGLGTRSGSGYTIDCTGTLIGANTVVTAGHCMRPLSNFHVVFGLRDDSTLQGRPIINAVAHEDYSMWFPEDARDVHDIGIVQFSGGLPVGYAPAPILPDDSVLANGTAVILAGYGMNDGRAQTGSGVLRYTEVPIAESNFGQTEIRTDEHKAGSCAGDSGGPGFVFSGGQYYVWGVTSRGDTLCNEEGIYTKINSYRAWIQQKTAAWMN